MSTTWGRLAGSTGVFAVEVRLIDDLDPVASVDADESASWGALRLWANGSNLTSHREADEEVTSLHWYLLPICEWLVRNWDALLHQERLPRPDVVDGVGGIERMAQQRLIGDDEEDALDVEVRDWWQRHNLAVGALGSVLPPTIIRRWGDHAEISMSARRQVSVPEHVVFPGSFVERVNVGAVAGALGEMLEAVSHELVRRRPASSRLAELRQAVGDLQRPDRAVSRLALPGAPTAIARELATTLESSGSVIEAAPPIALLFGSLDPDVTAEDIVAISSFVSTLPDRDVQLDRSLSQQGLELAPGPWAAPSATTGGPRWQSRTRCLSTSTGSSSHWACRSPTSC